ncbi:MAG: bacteriophage holin [Candidatus Micrarchaeota archaeon]
MSLNAKNFALAAGIMWGIGLFFLTLISAYTGYGASFLKLIMGVYPGYSISMMGSVVGLIYGFIDGFVGCYIFVWLYNKLGEERGMKKRR